eukprot:scaffold1950_cov366-Prasinococcus_capsulatus_cf.AAC.5
MIPRELCRCVVSVKKAGAREGIVPHGCEPVKCRSAGCLARPPQRVQVPPGVQHHALFYQQSRGDLCLLRVRAADALPLPRTAQIEPLRFQMVLLPAVGARHPRKELLALLLADTARSKQPGCDVLILRAHLRRGRVVRLAHYAVPPHEGRVWQPVCRLGRLNQSRRLLELLQPYRIKPWPVSSIGARRLAWRGAERQKHALTPSDYLST